MMTTSHSDGASVLDVARELGAKLRRVGREWQGGCIVCGGRDRFSVAPHKNLWNCRGCGKGGDPIDLVKHVQGVGYVQAKRIVDGEPHQIAAKPKRERPALRQVDVVDDNAKRITAAVARFVAGLKPIAGTPGEAYIRDVRGIDTAPIADVLGRTDAIGWNPSVHFHNPGHELHGQRLGCVVGIMSDVRTAAPTGAISRTYIGPDGRKVGKAKTLGMPAGIVRLSWDDDVTHGLFLAEGLETALAAMAIGLRPMWSTGSTGPMAKFPVLSGIGCVTVIADRDENCAGERAAVKCGQRWRDAGKEVRIIRRNEYGDLNDALKEAL